MRRRNLKKRRRRRETANTDATADATTGSARSDPEKEAEAQAAESGGLSFRGDAVRFLGAARRKTRENTTTESPILLAGTRSAVSRTDRGLQGRDFETDAPEGGCR